MPRVVSALPSDVTVMSQAHGSELTACSAAPQKREREEDVGPSCDGRSSSKNKKSKKSKKEKKGKKEKKAKKGKKKKKKRKQRSSSSDSSPSSSVRTPVTVALLAPVAVTVSVTPVLSL